MEMAVQAQHPSSYAFSPDFCNRSWDNAGEELHNLLTVSNACVVDFNKNAAGAAVLSGLQRSELTCHKSISMKRVRDAPSMAIPRANRDCVVRMNADEDNLRLPDVAPHPSLYQATAGVASASTLFPMNDAVRYFISSNDATTPVEGPRSREIGSAGVSTSGRTAFSSSESHAMTPLIVYINSTLLRQSLEMDALVSAQCERLRSELKATCERNCMALLTALEKRALKMLKGKEPFLEAANRRNAELEGMLIQAANDIQFWYNAAKNNEAMVATLRSRFEQAHNVAANPPSALEGFGDSDAPSYHFSGDRAAIADSDAVRWSGSCKACSERDVCVVVLPCRHLCLCKECESKVESCPICQATKNASLEVFMS